MAQAAAQKPVGAALRSESLGPETQKPCYSDRKEPQLTHTCLSVQVTQPSWGKVSSFTLSGVKAHTDATVPLLNCLNSKVIEKKLLRAFSLLFLQA